MEEKREFPRRALVFAKKHAVLLTLLLVLVLQFVPNSEGSLPWGGMWMRMQTKELGVTKSAAASTIDNFLNERANTLAKEQYPNLPEENRKKVVADLKKKVYEDNKAELEAQKVNIAKDVRNHFTYDVGDRKFMYMPDIDPYYYLRYARNIIETGHSYDEMRNGVPWDNHMIAPVGTKADPNWHSYVLAYIYKSLKIFDKEITLMQASNYFPIIFIFLSLILAFFVTRKVAGNFGGFFAVTVLALIPAIFGRTPWGHADTDAYNVFFPLLIVWLLFETFSAKTRRKQLIYAALTGLAFTFFANVWTGWWYLFDFVLAAFAVIILAEIFKHRSKLKEGVKSLWEHSNIKKFILTGVTLFISAAFFSSITIGISRFIEGTFRGAITFTTIKEAALPTLWPNVFTTVAELNPGSFNNVISSVGGTLPFLIAALGILLLLLRKDEYGKFDFTYSSLLVIWFIGTIYASIKGVRFTLLLGPAFAVAFGAGAGLLYQKLGKFGQKQLHINKIVVGCLLIVIFGLIIANPTSAKANMAKNSFNGVKNDIPLVNDGWWTALTEINKHSKPDAIINSWWDYGHHFKFISDRAVTSDGGTQNSPQAHWVGRALQTDNEEETVAILRMLDCGANYAFDTAMNKTKDPLVSIKLVKKIILQDKETAKQTVKEAGVSETILNYTHCDPPEDFFITSGDMIGKAGVWAHFGLWDFNRAEVWKKWRSLPRKEALPKMIERFDISEEQAGKMYDEANALSSEEAANQWISPWPGYVTQTPLPCKVASTGFDCGRINVNVKEKRTEVKVSQGTALAGNTIIYDKSGNNTTLNFEGNNELTVVLWPTEDGLNALAANTELADSMFTRLFYMGGLGSKHFKLFTSQSQFIGGMIYVWKIDWEGVEAFIPKAFVPKTQIEPGARVALNYIGWTDEGLFDSSIPNWKNLNVTKESKFDDFDTSPLTFVYKKDPLVIGFEKQIAGMKKGEEKTITVPPEEAYGTDPSKHELGNKTLHFKLKVEHVE